MKLITHKQFLKHKLPGHVERPERIKKVLDRFKYEAAKTGDIYLHKVHDPNYIEKVKKASKEGTSFLDAGDTYCTRDTYKTACYAVGASVQAAQYALKGRPAFALIRPPGHHAHPGWTGGFCIFNNVAIAAAYCAEKGKRVLIIDIDIHRGDGTQACVKELNKEFDGKLYYLSFNQQGLFPGASLDEGKIDNIYLPAGTSEKEYRNAMLENVKRVIKTHKPDIIAVSAGFDSLAKDQERYSETLGVAQNLTKDTIKALKKAFAGIPYFAVLEGGYDPESVLEGVTAFMTTGKKTINKETTPKEEPKKSRIPKKKAKKRKEKKAAKKKR